MVADNSSSPKTDLPQMVRIKTAAAALDVSEWAIRDWINRGKLKAVKLATRTVRIPASELERLGVPVESLTDYR